jgi:hypothetical protein
MSGFGRERKSISVASLTGKLPFAPSEQFSWIQTKPVFRVSGRMNKFLAHGKARNPF